MAYSCNYPILHPLSVPGGGFTNYTISFGRKDIYTGRVYSKEEGGGTVQVDISPVCREYLDTNYEALLGAVPGPISGAVPDNTDKGTTCVGTFTVGGSSYVVKYDYNTDFLSTVPDSGSLNDPFCTDVDGRQYIPNCTYSPTGFNIAATTNQSASPGTKLTVGGVTYTVVQPCQNRFVLYYVNKKGGLDAVLCKGRYVQNWSPERTDARLWNDRGNRLDFEQTRVFQRIDRQVTLNTGLINTDLAEKIDNLIYSPKVFIHDLDADTITSCLITDSSYSAKRRRYEQVVQYEFQIKESQQQQRK